VVLLVGELATGGAERVAATLANAWVRRGRRVTLVATYLASRQVGYALEPAVELVFLADRLAGGSGGALAKARALRRLVVALEPDVVLSFLTNVNVLAIAALARTGVPLVVSERTDPAADVELHPVLRVLRAVGYGFADRLVVQTGAAAQRFRRRMVWSPPVDVIPNPVPAGLAGLPAARHDGRGGTIVALGRLTRSKGFDALLRVFAREFGAEPAWRLEIWGDGPLRGELEALARSLGLGDRVRLAGPTAAPWEALAAAQLFALPSAYEGFPNAMLEAMALGLACVAYDCPSGPRELSGEGRAAVVVALGDEAAFGRELRRLAYDAAARARLGAAAAAHVSSEYGEAVVLERWDETFDAARGRPGPAAAGS
jgi:glycosyltransferase involved in cell wall biosynthesis